MFPTHPPNYVAELNFHAQILVVTAKPTAEADPGMSNATSTIDHA